MVEPRQSAGPFVVMGVSGCGKSTVAGMLAAHTGGLYLDADDFHPPENKAKMAASIPLTDEDRGPWLDSLNHELKDRSRVEGPVFLACSALRQIYRDRLSAGLPGLRFVYLKGSPELILQRLQGREGHFMPSALLASQFAALEEPAGAIVVGIEDSLQVMVRNALSMMQLPA
jgi:gluconokinase